MAAELLMPLPFKSFWRNMRPIALFSILVLLSAHLSAQAANTENKPWRISGTVVDSISRQPIRGSSILAQPQGKGEEGAIAAKSGRDGSFTINLLGTDKYAITVQKSGFIPQRFGQTVQEPNKVVLVAESDNSGSLGFELIPLGAIAGRIVDTDNAPLEGAVVQLLQMRVIDGLLQTVSAGRVAANDLGEYRFYGLRPGHYYIGAFYRDTSSTFGLNSSPTEVQQAKEGVSGDYLVTYYPGIQDPQRAGSVLVKGGMSTTNIDIRVQMGQSVDVEGHVEDLPQGAPARIMLQPADATSLGASQMFSIKPGTNTFLFRSIPPGSYALSTTVGNVPQQVGARYTFSVAGTPVRDIALMLRPPPRISGKVLLDGGDKVPADTRLVFIQHGQGVPTPPVTVQPDGTVRFSVLPGSYQLALTNTKQPILLKSISLGSTNSTGPLEISQSAENLSIVATTTVSTVKGTVVDKSNQPIGRGVVFASNDVEHGNISYWAIVDAQGNFKFPAMLAGDYVIACFTDLDSEADLSRETLSALKSFGQKISVGAGENKDLSLAGLSGQ